MNQTLLTLGGLTLGGSAAVLLLALAGWGAKPRYGAKWRCWAWLLLCLRLAIPLPLMPQAQGRAPIQVDLPTPPAAIQQPADLTPSHTSPDPTPSGDGGHGQPSASGGEKYDVDIQPASPGPVEPEREGKIALPQVLLGVWLLGAGLMLGWSGLAHIRFLSYLRRWSAPVSDEEAVQAFSHLGDQLGLGRRPRLLTCQGLKVPMLVGLFRPAVLLPKGSIAGEELGLSLLHELTHFRRRDIWLKTISLWVNALHWFNPLMWYMVRLVERDTELACDEDTLRRLPQDAYSAYGQTILAAVARLHNPDDL